MKVIKIDVEDEKYPQRLLKIKNFPTEIYALGNINLLNSAYTVAIVGARKFTEYGNTVASEFAKELSKKDICIVSGMAMGIDGIAHNVAIENAGKTIAVLGCGLNYIYPPENEWLFHKILAKGGCIVSEYPPEIEPDSKKFPIRNRIVSGLSDAVLVVEARYRSGSTITAKFAKEQGKRVYAIPNSIYVKTGVGTNILIQEGATLVIDPAQIVEEVKNKDYINDTKIQNKIEENIQKLKARGYYNKSNRNRKAKNDEDTDCKNMEKQMESREVVEKYIQRKDTEDKTIKHRIINSIKLENSGRTTLVNKENTINTSVNSTKTIMPKEYLQIYRVLSTEPIHINELAKKLGTPIYEITPTLTMMEIEGYAYQPQNNYFMRNVGDVGLESINVK